MWFSAFCRWHLQHWYQTMIEHAPMPTIVQHFFSDSIEAFGLMLLSLFQMQCLLIWMWFECLALVGHCCFHFRSINLDSIVKLFHPIGCWFGYFGPRIISLSLRRTAANKFQWQSIEKKLTLFLISHLWICMCKYESELFFSDTMDDGTHIFTNIQQNRWMSVFIFKWFHLN